MAAMLDGRGHCSNLQHSNMGTGSPPILKNIQLMLATGSSLETVTFWVGRDRSFNIAALHSVWIKF